MISKLFFDKKMAETLSLMGTQLKEKTLGLIYDKIRLDYEESDLEQSLDEIISMHDKLNYLLLKKTLDKYANERIDMEIKRQKMKEEEEVRLFWKQNYRYIKDGYCNRQCISCKVQYCDIITNESINNIKAILNKEKTIEQVDKEMADKFQGWETGFIPEPF